MTGQEVGVDPVPGERRRRARSTRGAPRSTERIRFATDDPDEAEQLITDLYLPNRLDLSGDPAPLAMEMTAARLGAVTVGRLTYGRPVRLRTADAQDFHVDIALRGRASSRSGGGDAVATHQGEGLVFSPGEPAEIWWSSDCVQLCLMVSRVRLEAQLEQLLGRSLRGRLRFDFVADLDNPLGRRWSTVLGLLVDELDQPTEMSQHPVVVDHVESLVIDGLLLGQPHSVSELPEREHPAGLSSAVRRAVELIEERPAEPWTTVRLATEVHLSPRALQAGFSREFAVPPMTYLRQVRLRRVRQALLAEDPGRTTVRAVALRFGILHMGRFAAAYRDAFGERPSDTLNGHAGRTP